MSTGDGSSTQEQQTKWPGLDPHSPSLTRGFAGRWNLVMAPSSRSKGTTPSCSYAREASTTSWPASTSSRGSRLTLWAWVNSMRSFASFPSSAGYSKSVMINDGCSHNLVHDKPSLHFRVGDRATGQPLSQEWISILEVARKVRAPELSCSKKITQGGDGTRFVGNRRRE